MKQLSIKYNEVKPAIKVTKLLEAIEAKYGITFGGSFVTSSPFDQLYLWAHRFEGYLYDASTTIDWQLVNMNRNTGSGSQFNRQLFLHNVLTESLTDGTPAYYNSNILGRYYRKDYFVPLTEVDDEFNDLNA